jgi:hypothetical protein
MWPALWKNGREMGGSTFLGIALNTNQKIGWFDIAVNDPMIVSVL